MEISEIPVTQDNNQYSKEERADHIIRWQESGLSKTEYSRQNNIAPTTFFHWTRKKQIRKKENRFVEVKVNDGNLFNENKIELIIGNRILKTREDISPEILTNILRVLEGIW